jgi:hypothetical protein
MPEQGNIRVEFVVQEQVVLVRKFATVSAANHYEKWLKSGKTWVKGMEVRVNAS